MTKAGTLLLLLTAIVAALAGILAFAVSKFFAAARTATRAAREGGAETAFMAAAMEEALQKMRKQERAMQARAEASERLSGEIIASLTSGLLVVSQEGIIRTLNPAGQQLLGLPNSELMRDYREELAGSSPLADVIQECLVARRPIVRRAVRMDRPGSGASHLGITVSPIRDESGHEHGAICLFTDLSEIADLEDQLRLKDSLARLGELTAGIAHEFRNGLATIHGYSRLLDLERLPADFKPYVQGIRQETEELGQVVTNFLNFAKPAELVLAPVDVGILAEKAAEEIRPEATARGGEVVVKGHFGVVEGDEVLLRQAFSNLCRNALEACAGSPRIVVEGG
jgi:PAS domain S-box-containing protein